MQASASNLVRPAQERFICLWLVLLVIAGTVILTPFHPLNADVTFLAWAAEQALGPAVYGRDIYDVNPPLAFMLYVPAALLAPLTGHDGAIRLWLMLLAILSVTGFWQVADKTIRSLLGLVLVMFFLFAFPDDFGQREQMAFLLCVPYVAGHSSRRGWAILNGFMAGVGFLIKPHFLFVPLLLFALRRTFRKEEWVIAAVAAGYCASLPAFFPAYVFEMVPMALSTYWAISYPLEWLTLQAVIIPLYALPLFLAGARQPASLPYLVATLGFAAAALLQGKGFFYHFIPAWGFLALYLAAVTHNEKRFASRAAALLLLAQAVQLGALAYQLRMTLLSAREVFEEIRAEVDQSRSFSSLSSHPLPVFPVAFYSPARYLGLAMCQIFMPAVAFHEDGHGQGDPAEARRLALLQAKRELARKPDLVIVRAFYHPAGDETFDSLSWLKRDEGFRDLWKDYVHTRTIADYDLYRRK